MRARVQWLAALAVLPENKQGKDGDKDACSKFRSAWGPTHCRTRWAKMEAYSQAISSSRATPASGAIRPRIDRRGWRGAGLPGLSYS